MRQHIILLVWIGMIFPVFADEPRRFEFEEPHMGTKFRIVLYAKDRETADAAAKASFARIAELNRTMSDYLADSELSLLCRQNAKTLAGPVVVSTDLLTVLAKAHEVSTLSNGAFDVTIGPVVKLWRQSRKDRRLPDDEVLKEALSRVGYQKLKINVTNKTVELLTPGMQLDLGGIAKGYAADECLKIIAKHGITQALVAASGDIAVSDAPPGRPGWKVEIGRLPGSKGEAKFVWLKNAAISTSGDEVQFVEITGTRYSHIVNPKTGIGLTGRRSVTVIAQHGIDADSLTKMASILPPTDVLAIVNKRPGIHASITVRHEDHDVTTESPEFHRLLVKD